MPFKPNFNINNTLINTLMKIEGIKEIVKTMDITPKIIKSLRESTKLESTHYSTAIEGNRLTELEVKNIINENKKIKGKERDEKEIKGYYLALDYIEKNKEKKLDEEIIQIIHALVEGGGRSKVKKTEYRDGQNVIRDSISGRIVYMPPEAKDVPILMKELIDYINNNLEELPTPVLAGIIHYQFATIHPYFDGNGRTARLLTNFILYHKNYDLNGIYSLEEYYANNLQEYYKAISIGDHHNYYFGRAEADITSWLEYFINGMLNSFIKIKEHTEKEARNLNNNIKKLNPQERKVLSLFEDNYYITSNDIANLFNFTQRSARNLANKLVKKEILIIENNSNKNRQYGLNNNFKLI